MVMIVIFIFQKQAKVKCAQGRYCLQTRLEKAMAAVSILSTRGDGRKRLPGTEMPKGWRFRGCRLLASVNRLASLLQSMFLGKINRRELFFPVVNRLGSAWMLYQCVVALPIAFCQLMELHFDLDTFVDSLNHGLTLPPGRNFVFQLLTRVPYRLPEPADNEQI
jgi:hypothetical protein